MQRKSTENGQALILIAIALVAILGFAALAIDGGHTYAEKRRAQNAADAASFAAARAGVEEEDWEQAALDQLILNDYFDTDLDPNPGAPVDVEVYNPPIDGPYSPGEIAPGDDPNLYYQVKITQAVTKSFSQLIFSGDLRVSVVATARAQPIMSVSTGNAMHGTNPSVCEGVLFNGGGDTWVDGGNVFSNSDKVGNCSAAQQNGSGRIRVTDGDIQTVGSFQIVGGSGTVSPAPKEGAEDGVFRVNLPPVPEPDCSGMTPRNDSNRSLQPGIYADGITIHNGVWTMAPGVYCLEDDFIVNGGSLTGKDVLIVMLDGSVDMQGNAIIHLIRADSIEDSKPNQFGGMLIYMPQYNHGGIDLGGSSGTSYAGTIYAPSTRDSNKSKCTFGGTSGSIGITSNIVCNTIQVHGNANVEIHYKAEENYQFAPMMERSE